MTSSQVQLVSISCSIIIPIIAGFVTYKVTLAILEYRMGLQETKTKNLDEWKEKHEKEHSENAVAQATVWGEIKQTLATLLERSKKWDV